MVIPNTWTWSVIFPINLVHWCLIFDTKLKLRYLLSDLKILTQKIRVGPYLTNTNNDQLILVDPVEDEERSSTNWSSLTMRDLNKRNIITHPIVIVFDHHFLYWLCQSNSFKYFYLCDHRFPSFSWLDLQEASKLTLKILSLWRPKENIL